MAHLQWKKACTQSKMKNVLKQTRQMQERDMVLRLGNPRAQQKAQWTKQVIRDEMQRPLDVSDQFMKEFAAKRTRDEEKFRASSKTHAKQIQRLQKRSQERKAQQNRHQVFREQKKLLERTPVFSTTSDE